MHPARRPQVGTRSSWLSDFPERLWRLPEDTVAALSFFSRLPVSGKADDFDLSRVAGAWPAAGLLLSLGPAAIVVLNYWLGVPPLVTAFLAVAMGIALTGALHEDGLADTFDGLGAGGGQARSLEVMRDSRLGTFGALALILTVLVKGSAIAALAGTPLHALAAFLGVAMISRALALWHWSALPPARHDGMAFAAGQPDAAALQLGLLSGLIGAIILVVALGLAALLGLALAGVATILFTGLIRRRLGGHTGDTIGAIQQITEALVFVGLSSATIGP